VGELVDNDAESASGDTGRGAGTERVRTRDGRADGNRTQSENPAPLQASGASDEQTRKRTHLTADRARTRASHVVDAPAGPAARDDVDDYDEDPFG